MKKDENYNNDIDTLKKIYGDDFSKFLDFWIFQKLNFLNLEYKKKIKFFDK